MTDRLIAVDDSFTLPAAVKVADANLPEESNAAKVAGKLDAAEAANLYAAKSVETGKLDATTAATLYAAKSVETTKLNAAEKGAPSGVAPLGADSAVPDTNLPARLGAAAINSNIQGQVQTQVPPLVASAIASDPAPATAAAAAVGDALTAQDILRGQDVRAARTVMDSTTYALPTTDKDGYVAGGVLTDGRWNFERTPKVKGQTDVTMRPLNVTGWAIPFADQDGYVAGGIRPDGTAEFVKLKLAATVALQMANEAAGYTRSSRVKVAAIGDSLTAGYYGGVGGVTADAYPAKLQAIVPAGVTVYNIGNSGYTVDEEAVRVGALPLPLTVTGGSIPATGPVTVTTTAVIGWRGTGTSRNIPGTLAGVAGILNRTDSDTSFTFTRNVDGTAVTVTGAPLFVPDYAGHGGDTAVILLGRNDVTYAVKGADTSVAEHVAKGIDRIVNWLTPSIKQVLIVSTTTTTSETSGTAGYATVADINARLAAAYPSRYLNLRSYLVNQAIIDLGITPTTADTTAMAGDTLPPSIMDGGTDNTHWSKATATLVAAQINNYLTTRGWV